MSKRSLWSTTVLCVGCAFVTRWPFRSEFLFSWDSANYALAMQRIDIAAHRPHPPGYLGYVAVARAINSVGGSVNDALVWWNIIATALAALILVRFAWEMAEGQARRTVFAASAGAIMLTSPLLWFYGEVAEIYASETLAAVTLAYLVWRAMRGRARALYWCAICIPLVAAFKLATAILMVPFVAYGWWRAPAGTRLRAGALLIGGLVSVGAVFLWTAPDFGHLLWHQFASATATSRLDPSGGADALERFNRNVRDTLTAAVSMLGVVNVLALAAWLLRDRRLPAGLDRIIAVLWLVPWVVLCVGIHIAKPGYLLPLLPIASLILAGFYVRQSRAACVALVVVQAAVNTAHFVALGPLSEAITGGKRPYREKSLLQRLGSDLQPLTLSTAATIRRSDLKAGQALAEIHARCPSGHAIVFAGPDARRMMWYLPNAVVVYIADRTVQNIVVNGDFTPVADVSREFSTACDVFWLSDGAEPAFLLPARATEVAGFGFVIAASNVRVSRTTIAFE